MAKSRADDLFDRLHAQGLRKRTAKLLSQATDRRRKPANPVERSLNDVKRAVANVEHGLRGARPTRRPAAKKAAATRKRNAQRRSAAAKKAARTRSKSS
jgi:hypothetical protein